MDTSADLSMQAHGSTGAVPPKPKGPKVAYKQPERGATALPAARVQRLIKADRDIQKCAKDAVFATSIATEYFIRKLTEAAYTQARLDKRKQVIYKDIASACVDKRPDGGQSEFFFLSEVVPKPVALSFGLERRKKRMVDFGQPYLSSATIKEVQAGHATHAAHVVNQALQDMPELLNTKTVSEVISLPLNHIDKQNADGQSIIEFDKEYTAKLISTGTNSRVLMTDQQLMAQGHRMDRVMPTVGAIPKSTRPSSLEPVPAFELTLRTRKQPSDRLKPPEMDIDSESNPELSPALSMSDGDPEFLDNGSEVDEPYDPTKEM